MDQPTNSINILDLIFCSNTDVISSVLVDNFPLISDHKLITANLAYQTEVQENLEEMHLTDSGSRLKKLNINMADWPAIQAELELVDWGEMESLVKESPTAAYNWFMKQLIMVMEHHCPARKKRSKNQRHRMDRQRRLLWKKLSKVKSRIKTASSIHKLTKLLHDKAELEQQLVDDYQATNNVEEDKVVFNMKANFPLVQDSGPNFRSTREDGVVEQV